MDKCIYLASELKDMCNMLMTVALVLVDVLGTTLKSFENSV